MKSINVTASRDNMFAIPDAVAAVGRTREPAVLGKGGVGKELKTFQPHK